MLKNTHRAFGATAMGITGLVYEKVTSTPITQVFIPQVDEVLQKTNGDAVVTSVIMDSFYSLMSHQLTMAVLMLCGALAGAVYPDIDQKVPGMRHRGWTHTIWALMIVLGIIHLVIKYKPLGFDATYIIILPSLVGFFIGYVSHLVGDAFSTSGIAWFYPIQRYHDYNGGASVVKGKRFIFQPIYKVGQRVFGIQGALFWTMVAIVVNIIWLLTF